VLHNKPSVQVKAALRLRVRGTTEAAHMATNPISIPSSNTTNGWEQTNRDRNLIGIHEHDDAFLLFTTHACLATPVTHVTVTGERETKKKHPRPLKLACDYEIASDDILPPFLVKLTISYVEKFIWFK
jgi:hypothetical protein